MNPHFLPCALFLLVVGFACRSMRKWISAWAFLMMLACVRECPEPWWMVSDPPISNSLALPVKKLQIERFIKEDEAVTKEVIASYCSTRFETAYSEFIRKKYHSRSEKNLAFGRDDFELFPPVEGEPELTIHEIAFSLLLDDTSLYFRALENAAKPPNDMEWDPGHGVYREVPYLMPRIVMFSIPGGTTLDQLTRPLSKVSGYPYYSITHPETKLIRLAIIYREDIDLAKALKRARILEEDPLISDVKVATCYPMPHIPFSRWW